MTMVETLKEKHRYCDNCPVQQSVYRLQKEAMWLVQQAQKEGIPFDPPAN